MSIEFVPPRNGADPEKTFEKLEQIKKLNPDFISVTKGAGGSLRGGTIPLTYFIKEKLGIDSIAHFTCREVTKEQIENELVDHHYFNITNILALRGDPPVGSAETEWNGEYKYAWQLADQISSLNKGHYMPRAGFEKGIEYREGAKTHFCVGVAAHPEHPDIQEEARFLKLKQDKGAKFAITQMIFDAKTYKDYVNAVRKEGVTIPILPGIRPITKYDFCLKTEEWFGVPVPDKFKEKMKCLKGDQAVKAGIDFAVELCNGLRAAGAPGLHFFVLGDIPILKKILEKL